MTKQKNTAKKTDAKLPKTVDVQAEVIRDSSVSKPQEGRQFSVDFNGMDQVITYLDEQLEDPGEIKFNPFTREYTFSDGTIIRSGFFTETMIKMTHYMNVVSRTMQASGIGMHPTIKTVVEDKKNNNTNKTED